MTLSARRGAHQFGGHCCAPKHSRSPSHWKTTWLASARTASSSLRARRANQPPQLQNLPGPQARARPAAGQHRDHGQPVQPQGPACPRDTRGRRREPALPPPYSPDFNRIENAFAKLKALLRRPPSGPSVPFGIGSVPASTRSQPPNEPTILPLPATMQHERILL